MIPEIDFGSSDCVLPSQYWGTCRPGLPEWQRRLYDAILRGAIADLTSRRRSWRTEAREWLEGDNEEAFGFNVTCELLGICDIEGARRHILGGEVTAPSSSRSVREMAISENVPRVRI
jgi:hypothetical protein